MLWIQGVEMVNSVDDLKSSCSIQGVTPFPDLELLVARVASALKNHPEFLLQAGQSGGTKGSKSRPIPQRQADRLLDLRLLPGHWRQRFCTRFCRLILYCSSERQYSGIQYQMGRNVIVYRNNSHLMIFWKVCTNWEHENMDTLTKSCSLTIVITANGEVQTREEAIVYVKELDIFLTMKVLDNTPAVLSLGKLCEDHGCSYGWTNGQKPCLIWKRVYNAIRRTTYQSWSCVYRRLLRQAHQQLKHPYRRKVQVPHRFQHQLKVREQMSKDGTTCRLTQPKIQNPIKMRITSRNGSPCQIPKNLNGCKNSGTISWKKVFLNLMDHTQVLSMNPL